MRAMPTPGSLWKRKSDGRIDQVKGHDGTRFITMYSPVTNRHWHIEGWGLYRKYIPVPAQES